MLGYNAGTTGGIIDVLIMAMSTVTSFSRMVQASKFHECLDPVSVRCLVGNGGMDPYSSPYIIPNSPIPY